MESVAAEYQEENEAVTLWRRHTGLNHLPGDARCLKTNEGEETETWTLFIDTAHRGKEFQMGGITGSIV